MERERRLEVTQWTPETIIAASIFPVTRRSRISPKLVGLVGTLFLHGLVVQLLILRMREVDAPLPVVTPGSVESLEGREGFVPIKNRPPGENLDRASHGRT